MEEEIQIRDDETLEDLQLGGLRLIQKKTGFRFGMDAVLLADFAAIRENDIVADFGTGSGILPVLLAGRGKGRVYYAIDIQEEMAETAGRNLALNRLEGKAICLDLSEASDLFPKCSLDAVICNPPYGEPRAALVSPDRNRAISRNQQEGVLDGFLRNAFEWLKGRGKISLVYPAASMFSMMIALRKHHLEPKRFRLVYPAADKNANLVLIEAVKDAKPTLHPMPPLIIYEKNGDLTTELKSIYHIREAGDNRLRSVRTGFC